MAAPEISSVVMEARAAVQTSHRLLDEMRVLRRQLNQSLKAVHDSTATLAANMGATLSGAVVGHVTTTRAFAVALPVDLPAADSQVAENANGPAARPLDPKDQIALDLLTPREIEVLRLIGEGQRTKEIAFALGITFKTAVTHRSNIMEKLGIHEGPRLVRFAIRTGITTA
jgi:DNA-binding NarL/FixJ family response regulator